jgi:hypothetical protein
MEDTLFDHGRLSGIALGYGLDHRGFESRQGLGLFLLTSASRPSLGSTQHPIQWVTGALSLGIKRLGREAHHSHPSSAEVKKYAFMAWCSVKKKSTGQLYLTFTLFEHPYG